MYLNGETFCTRTTDLYLGGKYSGEMPGKIGRNLSDPFFKSSMDDAAGTDQGKVSYDFTGDSG